MSSNKHLHSRLTMALDDLLMCKSYALKMLELPIGKAFSEERTVYEALFVALIVSYGRVFQSSRTTDEKFMDVVSNSFGEFRSNLIKNLEVNEQSLHHRLIDKRDTAIAHSDASSRNYQYYNDSPIGIGHNSYYPFEHEEVRSVLALVERMISEVGSRQSKNAKTTFKNQLFQPIEKGT